jgi:ABC-type molybdenum transport system ATPase subunit/photorepair protein PhrA
MQRSFCVTIFVEEDAKVVPGRVTNGNAGGPIQKGSCLLEFQGITLRFGQKTIFENLNLVIRSGECLVLLGPSGTGKSTFSAYCWRRFDQIAARLLPWKGNHPSFT